LTYIFKNVKISITLEKCPPRERQDGVFAAQPLRQSEGGVDLRCTKISQRPAFQD
jgi:hypothetical protein